MRQTNSTNTIVYRFIKVVMSVTIITAIITTVTSCASQMPQSTQTVQELHMSTATSASTPEFKPNSKTLFHYSGEISLHTQAQIKVDSDIITITNNAITQAITSRKAYRLADSESASYYIYPALVYGNEYSEGYFLQTFGLSPTLNENTKYQRASLVLQIKNGLGKSVWRGAIQIYGGADLASDQVEQRIQLTVAALVDQLPALKSQ